MLDDFGLVPTLARYLEGFQESTSIYVEFAADDLGELPDDVELALFRVAQECMENVRKHSGAREARVSLARANSQVTMIVADGGCGIPAPRAAPPSGIGLASMRERIEAVGGAFLVDSAPGQGVRVEARIPVLGPVKFSANGSDANGGPGTQTAVKTIVPEPPKATAR
jgi:signal transduction histidine kinase